MEKSLMRLGIWMALLLCGAVVSQAQDYRSLLRDRSTGEAIDGATVVLFASDSTSVAVTLSDAAGGFTLSGTSAKWLQVTHLIYHTLRVELDHDLPDTLYMEPKAELLDELVVKTERPIMTLLDGSIPSYNIDVLFENSPVTTAYEMLGRLPGMSIEGGVPVLVGTNGFTLVMNGKPSPMPQEQLMEMLKTIPVQMVANVEISYTPIAKYRAKGASINIVLKQQSKDKALSGVVGQLYATYTNNYFGEYRTGGNITYSDGKGFSITGNYKGYLGSSRTNMTFDTEPFGTTSGLHINNVGKSTSTNHTAFLDLTYAKEKHNISASYYGDFSPKVRYQERNEMDPDPMDRRQVATYNTHHATIEYSYDDRLMVGAFYTDYLEHKDIQYGLERTPISDRAFAFLTKQRSQVYGAHVDNSHKLSDGWGVEYGSKLSLSRTMNRQLHRVIQGSEQTGDPMERISKELLADAYVGVKKQFSPKLNMGMTLIGDYAKYYDHEENFQVIPQANLTYVVAPGKIVQATLAAGKKYPRYFEREPFVTRHSEYQQWQGNPDIRPYVSYKGQVVYILKSRYIFILADTYDPRHFVQLMYLDPKINQIVYKTWNWHYTNSLSATSVLPLPQTSWWQGRLTINGQYNSLKVDIPYEETMERHRLMLFVGLTNDFTISKKNNLTAGLDLRYVTGGMQGYYNFSDMYMLDLKAKWMSADKKWSITASANDLLNRAIPRIHADYGIHKFDFVPSHHGRTFSLDVRYTIGSFKSEKKPSQLKTDRFGM